MMARPKEEKSDAFCIFVAVTMRTGRETLASTHTRRTAFCAPAAKVSIPTGVQPN